jgi:hypothetical protein
MRVLICGDRNWKDYKLIKVTLSAIPDVSLVIEGECRGADVFGKAAALSLGIPVEKYPADWNAHGKAAGPIRNRLMLDAGKPDLVLAFHDDIEHSKGTKDMKNVAESAGIEVRVITHETTNQLLKG